LLQRSSQKKNNKQPPGIKPLGIWYQAVRY